MRSKLRRIRGLVQRYRIDRRLPPQVLELFTSTARLRRDDARAARRAHRRAVIGPEDVPGTSVARLDDRRLVTVGPLATSTHELGHEHARAVCAALGGAGVATFVVGRHGDGLEMGVALADRRSALDALSVALGEPGWYLHWFDGSGDGLVALPDAVASRRVRRSREWKVFRAHAWGDRAVGHDEATTISFWDVGTSGKAERIGTRGHDRYDVRSAPTVEVVDGHEYPGLTAFPVGADLEHLAESVDVVFTWVDGADPEWAASFRETAAAVGRSVDETALDPARYRTRDELRYALRSVWAYCGWVRKIWIVTAGQRPAWLVESDRIAVVDHSEILPASALPTFNSHSIESALHHIDGLAERFVYFNDDMAMGRPTRPELFFTCNGLARVFLSSARIEGAEDDDTLAVDTGALRGRELLAERFGRVATFKPYHAPYSLRRSTLERLETEFSDIVGRTAHSRFRAPTDLSIAASFALHYGIAVGDSVRADLATEYVHVESGRLQWHLDHIRLSDDLDTFCINETSVGNGGLADREDRIMAFYEEMFPIAAPWERSIDA